MTAVVDGILASEVHRAELTAYCRRMLGSSFDAEDAVQETLLRAWRASGRFEGRAPLRAWLYRIARNVCLDALGHAARQPMPVHDVSHHIDACGEPDPSDPCNHALARDRLRLAVIAAIANLPPRQRAVLLLRDVLSWRAAEVAELLATTPAGVNSALQRARAALEEVDPEAVPESTEAIGRGLVARYLAAFAEDDVDALVSLSRAA
ncbi:MAG: sigma-70 family RNA polymerase sigma factor [Solirubrobacteraceae bacterium]